MSSLAQRGGRVNIRVGGNTQDYATLVSSNSNGKMIQKQKTGNTNPVGSIYSPCLVKQLTSDQCEDTNAHFGFHGGSSLHTRKCFKTGECPLVPW